MTIIFPTGLPGCRENLYISPAENCSQIVNNTRYSKHRNVQVVWKMKHLISWELLKVGRREWRACNVEPCQGEAKSQVSEGVSMFSVFSRPLVLEGPGLRAQDELLQGSLANHRPVFRTHDHSQPIRSHQGALTRTQTPRGEAWEMLCKQSAHPTLYSTAKRYIKVYIFLYNGDVEPV